MQYLLTKEEYDALKKVHPDLQRARENQLARLCILATTFVPRVTEAGFRKLFPNTGVIPSEIDIAVAQGPHGCIHSDAVKPGPMYCDHCPVQNACPMDKEWSK